MEGDSLFPDQFFIEIKEILQKARRHAYKAINTVMIEAYWRIGQRIVEREQLGDTRASYGDELIQKLSQSLQEEFGKGFSYANLKNFRQFYLNYSEEEIGYALRSQLTWTHHRSIMRVESKEARMYYLKEANEQGWSTRTLDRNINTFYYQRVLSSREKDKEGHDKPASQGFISQDFIKDPYVFEFLDIPEPKSFSEKNIEQGLISSLQEFLLELGKGFSFVGRQYRISTETEHYYIDLVFYNYLLKCFVLIDLKTGKLSHQDIGQMDMYRRMFDDLKKPEGDTPTIGIILCTDKSETVVKYSVMQDNPRVFASKYMPYLPTEEELIAEIERDKQLLSSKQNEQEDSGE